MMTFLPFEDFNKSARCLDRQRLGKQRVEVLQILNALNNEQAWFNHPITKMWKGYELLLIDYGRTICNEWVLRGYVDNTAIKIVHTAINFSPIPLIPKWLGDERLHRSHRSNLIRKMPLWYKYRLGWNDPDNLNYWYPNV